MARTADPQIYTESIIRKAFRTAAQDGYMELQETYTWMFEDQHKNRTVMSALAEVIYCELQESEGV